MKYFIQLFMMFFLFVHCNGNTKDFQPHKTKGVWESSDFTLTITDDSLTLTMPHINLDIFNGKIENRVQKDSVTFLEVEEFSFEIHLLTDNAILLIFNKSKKGIETHIDEYLIMCREDYTYKYDNQELETHILPNNFQGTVFVNYGKGEECMEKKRTLNISKEGLCKVSCKEIVTINCLQQICFIDKNGKKIHIIDNTVFQKADYSKEELERRYINILGFNQNSREMINERFNEVIKGNVFMYEVITLDKLLKKNK
jgi:hypothetical protein